MVVVFIRRVGSTMSSPIDEKTPKGSVEGDPLPLNLIKSLGPKTGSETGENGSSNGGNNSDNSALVSIGNTSFGFNFDSEDGNNSGNNSKAEQNDIGEDSDGSGRSDSKVPAKASTNAELAPSADPMHDTSKLSLTDSSNLTNGEKESSASAAHKAAAANAVENLKSIANSCISKKAEESKPSRKRKASDKSGNDSGGYNSDDEGSGSKAQPVKTVSDEPGASSRGGSAATDSRKGECVGGSPKGKKKKKLDTRKREERNAREKERSFRISKQINELRNLLSSGGVIVPKGTKSSVLTEAANYIRMLQQHQYRSEIDRHQLVQQIQLIGSGTQGAKAANAIRHVAAQNGVWSLGNFGGVPPKSAMTFYQASNGETPEMQPSDQDAVQPTKINPSEYQFIFNACGVGMAIASMGGAFIDCNQLFSQLTNYSKQEVCSMTIFNLTARQDLQHAFDLISQMISPPMDGRPQDERKKLVLRGALQNRNDIGLCVSLVKGDDGIAKCFCVTLIKNPASPFDTSKPIPVSFDSVLLPDASCSTTKAQNADALNSSPAFTSG